MIKVRKATIEDAKIIADIYEGWADFRGILPDKLCELEEANDIQKSISSGRVYFIAEIDGVPAGVNYVDNTFEYLESIRLGDMLVKKELRKNGVGSALIDNVIEYAKNNKVKKVWLWTQEELAEAIKFYESKGFIFEGKQKSQFCGKDALLYGLVLD